MSNSNTYEPLTNMNTYRLFNPSVPSQYIIFRTADQWNGQVRVTYLRGATDLFYAPVGGPYLLKDGTPVIMDAPKARELWDFISNQMDWQPD